MCDHLKKLDEKRKKTDLTKKKDDSEKKEVGAEGSTQQQPATSSNTTPTEESDESTLLVRKLVDELAPLWEELSTCLSLLEKVDDSQHAVLCLQNGKMR